jgi:peroxiredoxin
LDEIRQLGAEVFGISADSHFALAAWARERGFTYPLLSDWGREVITAYDVKLEELAGYRDVPDRAIITVDRDGTIVYRDRIPRPRELPDVDAAVRRLRELAERR